MSNYTPHVWTDGSLATPINGARLNELEAGIVAVDTAQAARQPALIPTVVKTSAYTAVAGDLVPVDLSSASVTATLPAAPADKAQIAVKVVTAGASHTLTVATSGSDVFNKSAGSTSLTFSLINQGAVFQYKAAGAIWYLISDYVPLSGLDSRFVATVTNADSTITMGGTTTQPTIAVATSSLDTRYQPLDADLTTIAGLSNAANNMIVGASGGGWSVRSKSLLAGDLGVPDLWPLTSGESTFPRLGLNTTTNLLTSQALTLCYFTARKTETITQIRVPTGSGAAATVTSAFLAVYSEDPTTSNLTQAASAANDTALFAASGTEYTKTFTASFTKTAGTRYAVAVLVNATTTPSFLGIHPNNTAVVGTVMGRSPRVAGQVTGQTSLPATVTAGSITSPAPRVFYAELLP